MMTRLKELLQKHFPNFVLLLLIVSVLLLPLFPVSLQGHATHWLMPVAYAQREIPRPLRTLLIRTGLYTPRPRGTAPTGRRVGGAGRGPICALADGSSADQIKALVPASTLKSLEGNQGSQTIEASLDPEDVGSYTIAQHPTFWFYIPYISTPETPPKRVAQFVVLDENNAPVWNELISIELQERPRFVEYSLPFDLESEQVYRWFFSVICDVDKLSRNTTVRGWVQRVIPTPELEMALAGGSYISYADNDSELVLGLDTISAFMNTYRRFPNTYKEDLDSLLEYFEIPAVDQPIILESAQPSEREVVKGNQLPANM